MLAHEVIGYAQEPGSGRPKARVKTAPASEGGGKGLGGQVIGQPHAEAAGYEVVDGDEIDFEAVLEVNQADDGPLLSNSLSRPRPPHI